MENLKERKLVSAKFKNLELRDTQVSKQRITLQIQIH